MDPQRAVGLARLIPGAAPEGCSEDNGDLLAGHIIWGLPADVFPTIAAVSRGLKLIADASTGMAPECGPPLISFADALATNHQPAIYWYLTSPDAETYKFLGYPRTMEECRLGEVPGYHILVGDYGDEDDLVVRADETSTVATILAGHGNLGALQMAHELGCPMDVRVYARAAEHNHVGLMQWAYDNGCSVQAADGLTDSWVIHQALNAGHPIHDLEGIWEDRTCCLAAGSGSLEALQWAHAHEFRCDNEFALGSAAAGGHLEVMQWLRAQDPQGPWDNMICSRAATGGHLAALQWLCAQDPPCPWDTNTCTEAAAGGHLEVLQWAHERGAPRRANLWHVAEKHLNVLQWLRAIGDPKSMNMDFIYYHAAKSGRLDIMQWLRQAWDPPVPWGDRPAQLYRAARDHPAIVQWLRENGCPE